MKLSVIPENASINERTITEQSQSLEAIAQNPLYVPYSVSGYIVSYISDSVRGLRAISILFLALCSVALYRILKHWHSETVALLASILFATNAVVLSIGRLASPLVLLFGWPLIIALLLWVQHGSSRKFAPITLLAVSAVLFYIPGALYFFILLGVIFQKSLRAIVKSITRLQLLGGSLLFLLLILPLILSFIQDPSLINQWLLLPSQIQWSNVPRNILLIPSAFIFRAPIDPQLTIGRLPILDVATGAFMLLGLYLYQQNMKLERTKIILVTGLFAVILGALGATTAAILILLPFVYVLVASGIAFLLDRWYAVFPRNPLARSFGLVLISAVVALIVAYHATRFFIVWPLAPETRNTYNQSRLVQ